MGGHYNREIEMWVSSLERVVFGQAEQTRIHTIMYLAFIKASVIGIIGLFFFFMCSYTKMPFYYDLDLTFSVCIFYVHDLLI